MVLPGGVILVVVKVACVENSQLNTLDARALAQGDADLPVRFAAMFDSVYQQLADHQCDGDSFFFSHHATDPVARDIDGDGS